MLKIENIVTEIKNAFDDLTDRLDIAKKRISEVEDTSIEFSETKEQRKRSWGKKKKKSQNRISKDCMTITKGVTYMYWGKQQRRNRTISNTND